MKFVCVHGMLVLVFVTLGLTSAPAFAQGNSQGISGSSHAAWTQWRFQGQRSEGQHSPQRFACVHLGTGHANPIFLHYWGRGNSEDLATGFRAALDVLGK